MSTYNYGSYAVIHNAFLVALQMRWIARIGYDNKTGQYWVEYVGKAK